jgi:hypothetical protein
LKIKFGKRRDLAFDPAGRLSLGRSFTACGEMSSLARPSGTVDLRQDWKGGKGEALETTITRISFR